MCAQPTQSSRRAGSSQDAGKWADTEASPCGSSLLTISVRKKSKQDHLRVRTEGAGVSQGLNFDLKYSRSAKSSIWLFYLLSVSFL